MATKTKKNTTTTAAKPTKKPAAKVTKTATKSVRYSAVPKASTVAKTPVSFDQIAERAYLISTGAEAGSEFENWLRAEKELRAAA